MPRNTDPRIQRVARAIYTCRVEQNVPLDRERGQHRLDGEFDRLSQRVKDRWCEIARWAIEAYEAAP